MDADTTRKSEPHQTSGAGGGAAQFRCLSVDLEVGVRDRRIHALAAVRSDTGLSLTFDGPTTGLIPALARLDDFGDGAGLVLGHNLIAFDLPHFQAASPGLRLLRMAAVDTLRLNPLAFPRNPYHHLVKHYQDGGLKRGRVNDPELDARLALEVFGDQFRAFRDTAPDLLTAWHWLTAADNGSGFDQMFTALRDSPRPSDAEAHDAVRARLAGNSCRTHAQEVLADPARHGWALAYALAWLSVAGGNSVMPPWVRHQFPEAGRLVRRLRDRACADPGCGWCRDRHDAEKELARWFGFPGFRPEPADEDGRPLQKSIAEAAMAGEHVLGILPTGTGKSVCYQVPALSRYDKTGTLTVVISPLVALMADQVAGLEARGIGILRHRKQPPVHAGTGRRPGPGAAGGRGHPSHLAGAAAQRLPAAGAGPAGDWNRGCWTRPTASPGGGTTSAPTIATWDGSSGSGPGNEPIPPVLCLTATAKPDVTAEIVAYFKHELDIGFDCV